ncbi:MAG: hypothetical protein MJ180_06515 [Candidatus Gastranaerophilales bacterium]|nr:hypothetical protein [Candidatus Gastranaerophilales bacterium]
MTSGITYVQTLEEYAKFKKLKALEEIKYLSCEECRYCRASVNACIFGNQVRNLDNLSSCPRVNKFLQTKAYLK